MASNPDYLEANSVEAIMLASGKLDRLTKEIIAVAVSAVNACAFRSPSRDDLRPLTPGVWAAGISGYRR